MSLSKNFPVTSPSLLLDFAKVRRLDPRITFTRASPAVYYDGVTSVTAEQNLALQSQEFQQWTTPALDTTVTANTTVAPDGTTTADTISFLSTGYRYQGVNVLSLLGRTFTFSCWVWTTTAKATIGVRIANSANGTDSASTLVSLTSTPTRISVTRTFTLAGTTAEIGFDNRTSVVGGAGAAGDIVVWGGQLEERSTVTAYTPTTTTAITKYIPVLLTASANTARFDADPITGQSLGLLIEEARTNIILRSQEFNVSPWGQAGSVTVIQNTIIAPDGTVTGAKIQEGTSAGFQNRFQSVSQSATTYAFSIYVKKGENDRFVMFAGSPQALLYIDMTSWTVYSSTNVVSSSITAVGNGWYRCTLVYTNSGAGSFQTGINLIQNSTTLTVNYAGNGWNGIFIWGAQLEAGAFATTYISTVATTQIRNKDIAYLPVTGWYSDSGAGTVYAEVNGLNSVSSIGTNTSWFGFYGSSALTNGDDRGFTLYNGYNFLTRNPVSTTPVLGYQTGVSKITLAVDNTGKYASKNGGAIGTVSGAGLNNIVAPSVFSLCGPAVSTACYTLIKIAYYDSRLTNAQLQALTQS